MSHNISVAIAQSTPELTQTLIENDFSVAEFNGWLVIGAQKGIRSALSKHCEQVVFANTDYFGGAGNQSARLINLKTNAEKRHKTINQALKELGVTQPSDFDSDLYDWVGLGKIRSNKDIMFYAPKDVLSKRLKEAQRKLDYVANKMYFIMQECHANESMSSKELFSKLGDAVKLAEEAQAVLEL